MSKGQWTVRCDAFPQEKVSGVCLVYPAKAVSDTQASNTANMVYLATNENSNAMSTREVFQPTHEFLGIHGVTTIRKGIRHVRGMYPSYAMR